MCVLVHVYMCVFTHAYVNKHKHVHVWRLKINIPSLLFEIAFLKKAFMKLL